MTPLRPRLLRVLPVNDVEEGAKPEVGGYFEAVGTKPIRSFVTSQEFWADLEDPDAPPDIVPVDVNFELDVTSPLQGEYTKKPTGLLYAIPLLAWCRASLRPTAVVFHTADPTLFAGDKVPKVMNYLAIELASLAAAIHEGGRPLGFGLEDILDWGKLCVGLRDEWETGVPCPGRKVLERLSKANRKVFLSALANDQADKLPKHAVIKVLNELLAESELYRDEHFQRVAEKTGVASVQEESAMPRKQVERRNRYILEECWPGTMSRSFQVTTPGRFERIFVWIRETTVSDARCSIQVGVESFRKRLAIVTDPQGVLQSRVIVDPQAHSLLLARCAEAAGRPPGTPIRPDAEGWPGLVLVLPSGKRDSISVQSLFGEVPVLRSEHFDTKHSQGGSEPWKLIRGRPSIGHYLEWLGDWTRVYAEASRTALLLPDGEGKSGQNLNERVRNSVPAYDLVRFLVLMFQIVKQYKAAWKAWEDQYRTHVWTAKRLRFTDRHSAPDSLKMYLAKLHEALRSILADGKMPEDELLDALEDHAWAGVYVSCRLQEDDILDSGAFQKLIVKQQKAKTLNPGKRIVELLATEEKQAILSRPGSGELSIAKELSAALNSVIPSEQLYKREYFSDVKVAEEDLEIYERFGSAEFAPYPAKNVERMNRRLLEGCYPEHIARQNSDVFPEWLRVHLELLEELGAVRGDRESEPGVAYWSIDGCDATFPENTPCLHPSLRPSWISFDSREGGGGALSALIATLGFDYPNEVYRVAESVGWTGPDFLRALYENQECPGWLRILCQEFALSSLHWTEVDSWPEFMQKD